LGNLPGRRAVPRVREVEFSLPKKALIIGITGQDGSFLAEFLLARQYQVHGVVRRASTFNTERLDGIYADPHEHTNLFLHYGDVTDASGLRHVIEKAQPDEIYNLAAQSHVRVSFDQPEYTADVVATGTLRLLESLRDYVANTRREVRFYQAGSSEMFGAAPPPQNESTPFYPRSPYAASKVAAHWYAVNYREAYGLFISNGILFNHESAGGRLLLPARSRGLWAAFNWGCNTSCFWETWMRAATGAMPATMWKRCG
jgi:GDPmannose 4,6-dehydratase